MQHAYRYGFFRLCIYFLHVSIFSVKYFQINEQRHDKTNKMSVRPARTQIRPGWSEYSLSAWRKLGSLSYPLSAEQRLWSDWADAQADLSLRWAHTHFIGFVMLRLKYWKLGDILGMGQDLEKYKVGYELHCGEKELAFFCILECTFLRVQFFLNCSWM